MVGPPGVSGPRPDKSPSVAPPLPPTAPPGWSGSCTDDAVTTIRFTFGASKLASKKCPKWFVPTQASKPSAVVSAVSALVDGTMPAFKHKTSSGLPASSSANCRTDASDAKSQTMGTPPPACCTASADRALFLLAW